MLEAVHSLEEFDETMREAALRGGEPERVSFLAKRRLADPRLVPASIDPFSSVYRDEVRAIHAKIFNRENYDPTRDELIEIDPEERAKRPGIYRDGGSHFLGTFLEAIGQILQVADLQPGQKVVEYGPGDGQISVPLARMGCEVAVVDIEAKYLETIERQAAALGLRIDGRLCNFEDDPGLRGFDLALFFESFHHSLDHCRLLTRVYDVLNDDGRVIFAGEPITAPESVWVPVIPGAWGLRLDGLSVSAVRRYGWMELGFTEAYFVEALMRCGFRVEKRPSTTNARGTCYVARKMGPRIDLSDSTMMLDVFGEDSGWHAAESNGRWTKQTAHLTLPRYPRLVWHAEIPLRNYRSDPVRVIVSSSHGAGTVVEVPAGGSLKVRLPNVMGRLTFETGKPVRLSEQSGIADDRVVGCFVEHVDLSPIRAD